MQETGNKIYLHLFPSYCKLILKNKFNMHISNKLFVY